MLRKRLFRLSVLGLLLAASGCGFFRDRMCNRPGLFMSRFNGTRTGVPVEIGQSDCGCEGTLMSNGSGPMLGNPIISSPGGNGAILPNPNPIPQIKEGSGTQKEYVPGMGLRGTKINEAKVTKDGN
jgi:hypothetical protein